MTADPRIKALLEELLDTGKEVTTVCSECPELLPQVQAKWQRIREVQGEINSLFPESFPTDDLTPTTDLPKIRDHEVKAVLGRGGMGVVYKAWHVGLKREVAVKMLLAGDFASPRELERFLREAQTVAGMNHPNIVQVFDVGNADGRPYFTMELVDGQSLAQKFEELPQPAREAAALVKNVAKAVAIAHQHGIIHRDLTPTNILLTSDGTPKITDFGLARRMEEREALTLTGAAIGTPNYMAPEQALGQKNAIGPATDVYAIGAILYKLLTGKPPLPGDSVAATLQRVISDDPVPPSRLVPKLPRDLQTICLKCLNKEPHRRYASAAALAQDLEFFEHGQPITARPLSLMERGLRAIRKHPTLRATLVAGGLLALALVGIGVWWRGARFAAVKTAIEEDLREVESLEQKYDYANAAVALNRAHTRVGSQSPVEQNDRLASVSSNLALVRELDAIRLDRRWVYDAENLPNGSVWLGKYTPAAPRFEKAFREAIGNQKESPSEVAARVAASPVRDLLLAALDQWAACSPDRTEREWVLAVARLADPDPWRDRVRDPAAWDSPKELGKLVAGTEVAKQPPAFLVAVEERLRGGGVDSANFLMGVVLAHPSDFWANVAMGGALAKGAPREASSYYRTALAIRPDVACIHDGLGVLYYNSGRIVEAMEHFHTAVSLAPLESGPQNNLGIALFAQGQHEAALSHLRDAIRLNPGSPRTHRNLGLALESVGQRNDALKQFEDAHRLDPNYDDAWVDVGRLLLLLGRGPELRREWAEELASNPPYHWRWFGYAELCIFLGENDEYRRACRDLQARFTKTTDPYVAERVARACLLAPGSPEEVRQAGTFADFAYASTDFKYREAYKYFRFVKGLTEYRLGHYEQAMKIVTSEPQNFNAPFPHIVLAMARYQAGQKSRALKTFANAVVSFDWTLAKATNRDPAWISHVLRREAEAMMLPFLPQFLAGKYQPQSNDERFALIGACQCKGLRRLEAGLYAAAYESDPKFVRQLLPGRLFPAARAAAVAGCGGGADGTKVSDQDRARWREQALLWLQIDLQKAKRVFDSGTANDRGLIQFHLNRWRTEEDLAGIRDLRELEKLPPDERQKYSDYWKEVDSLYKAAGDQTRNTHESIR